MTEGGIDVVDDAVSDVGNVVDEVTICIGAVEGSTDVVSNVTLGEDGVPNFVDDTMEDEVDIVDVHGDTEVVDDVSTDGGCSSVGHDADGVSGSRGDITDDGAAIADDTADVHGDAEVVKDDTTDVDGSSIVHDADGVSGKENGNTDDGAAVAEGSTELHGNTEVVNDGCTDVECGSVLHDVDGVLGSEDGIADDGIADDGANATDGSADVHDNRSVVKDEDEHNEVEDSKICSDEIVSDGLTDSPDGLFDSDSGSSSNLDTGTTLDSVVCMSLFLGSSPPGMGLFRIQAKTSTVFPRPISSARIPPGGSKGDLKCSVVSLCMK